ncbi:hypothetical protein MCOR25_010184 [Pyricularia grisea]|nr:hypothetical protein MCOR25_010184 [Pyricularia grisea]
MLFKTCVILGLAAIASTQKCAGSIDGGTSCSTYVSPANAEVNIAGTRNLYKRDASAKKKYMQAFPYGFWELATSGEENLCGIRALVYSLQHQMPGLEHIFDEHEMQNLAYTGPVDGIVWISHQDNHYEGLAPATAEGYRKHKEEC